MTDIVDSKTRSRMMAGIRSKDTKPELVLRRALHARGLRYWLHGKAIKGRPDIVLPRFKAVIFVHGCFWHRHFGCRYAKAPSTRSEFWHAKFAVNVARDAAVKAALLGGGWRVATIWGCALRRPQQIEATVDVLAQWLAMNSAELEIGEGNADAGGSSAITSQLSPMPGVDP